MEVKFLSEYIQEIGNPRRLFMNMIGSDARSIHTSIINSSPFIDDENHKIWGMEGLVIIFNDELENIPILAKVTNDNNNISIKYVDCYARRHLVSSIIKNIMFNDTFFQDDDDYDNEMAVRSNAIQFMFLYFNYYNPKNEYTALQLSESTILTLSETITTLQDKSLTAYRNNDAYGFIVLLQAAMRKEMVYKLNLESK